MAEAAGRDRIARQYVTVYEDVFRSACRALEAARGRAAARTRWSTLAVYLAFLAGVAGHPHRAQIRAMPRPETVRREAAGLARSARARLRSRGLLADAP